MAAALPVSPRTSWRRAPAPPRCNRAGTLPGHRLLFCHPHSFTVTSARAGPPLLTPTLPGAEVAVAVSGVSAFWRPLPSKRRPRPDPARSSAWAEVREGAADASGRERPARPTRAHLGPSAGGTGKPAEKREAAVPPRTEAAGSC